MEDHRQYVTSFWFSSPFVVLSRAGAVGDGDGPVKVLAVEAGGVGGAPLEGHLPAQQTLVPVLI